MTPVLPRVYPIVDTDRVGDPLAFASALIAGGARIFQLRSKQMDPRGLAALAKALAALARGAGVRFVVNDRADIAALAGADGLHLGQSDLPPKAARALFKGLIGLSTHNAAQVAAAQAEPVDYLGFGPVFATATKADPDPVTGLKLLSNAARASRLPVAAIGGISPANAAATWRAGAASVALISALGETPGDARREMEAWNALAARLNAVLAVGGWDPTGGAGIVADVKAVHACGGYALTALTGLAVQTPRRVLAVEPVRPALLAASLEACLATMKPGAVKTGMMGTPRNARLVFDFIRSLDAPWVFDPVDQASDGTPLGALPWKRAFPRKAPAVITPNRIELGRLVRRPIRSQAGLYRAAEQLLSAGFAGVLVKGGHAKGGRVRDELITRAGCFLYDRRRLTGSLHGSGCTLASGLAAFLAAGHGLPQAFFGAEFFMDAVWRGAWPRGGARRLSTLP